MMSGSSRYHLRRRHRRQPPQHSYHLAFVGLEQLEHSKLLLLLGDFVTAIFAMYLSDYVGT